MPGPIGSEHEQDLTFSQKSHDLFGALVDNILRRVLDHLRIWSDQVLDGLAASEALWQLLQFRVLGQVEGLETRQVWKDGFRQVLEQVAAGKRTAARFKPW